MFVVHGTKKFLDRVHSTTPPAPDPPPVTTILGAWYATVLLWQRQIAFFLNEPTRLPLFVPLAPAATVIPLMTQTAAAVFTALGLSKEFITREVTEIGTHQLTKTANRSLLGSMNDFAYLAENPPHSKETDRPPRTVASPNPDTLPAAISTPHQPRPRNHRLRQPLHPLTRHWRDPTKQPNR
jgi:hypothetical protein